MWSRVVEVMLGCWLLVSPFVFRYPAEETAWWANDFAAGAAVIAFGVLSYWRPTRHAHLLTIGVAIWLIAFAYVQAGDVAAPALQNSALLGLTLLMFAIIPNHASQSPESWSAGVSG